jgi:guanylate kinase
MNTGILLVVTGPSGAGKGTVLGQIHEKMEGVYYSVSATTREMREGEVDGESYYFVNRAEFDRMIDDDELLEFTEYCGNCYGTPIKPVLAMLMDGKTVILEIDVKGATQIRRKYPDAVLVFLTPSSREELHRRLVKRGTEDPAQIEERMLRAAEEEKYADKFDYLILNDQLETAVEEMASVITAERCRPARRLQMLKEGSLSL